MKAHNPDGHMPTSFVTPCQVCQNKQTAHYDFTRVIIKMLNTSRSRCVSGSVRCISSTGEEVQTKKGRVLTRERGWRDKGGTERGLGPNIGGDVEIREMEIEDDAGGGRGPDK